MKKLFLLVVVLLSVNLFAQDPNEKLPWQESYKLNWNDFRATPDVANPFDASTSSGLSYSFSYSQSPKGKIDFQYHISSNFYPNKSWTKSREKSEELLAHEQVHFDISELHARILREMVIKYRPTNNVKQDLKKMYDAAESMRQKMQELFDEETDHGLNREQSKKWKDFVASELARYKRFSS